MNDFLETTDDLDDTCNTFMHYESCSDDASLLFAERLPCLLVAKVVNHTLHLSNVESVKTDFNFDDGEVLERGHFEKSCLVPREFESVKNQRPSTVQDLLFKNHCYRKLRLSQEEEAHEHTSHSFERENVLILDVSNNEQERLRNQYLDAENAKNTSSLSQNTDDESV